MKVLKLDGFSKEVLLFGQPVLRPRSGVYLGRGWSVFFETVPGLMLQGWGWLGDQQFYCRSRGDWALYVGKDEADVSLRHLNRAPHDDDHLYEFRDEEYGEAAELEALWRILTVWGLVAKEEARKVYQEMMENPEAAKEKAPVSEMRQELERLKASMPDLRIRDAIAQAYAEGRDVSCVRMGARLYDGLTKALLSPDALIYVEGRRIASDEVDRVETWVTDYGTHYLRVDSALGDDVFELDSELVQGAGAPSDLSDRSHA